MEVSVLLGLKLPGCLTIEFVEDNFDTQKCKMAVPEPSVHLTILPAFGLTPVMKFLIPKCVCVYCLAKYTNAWLKKTSVPAVIVSAQFKYCFDI